MKKVTKVLLLLLSLSLVFTGLIVAVSASEDTVVPEGATYVDENGIQQITDDLAVALLEAGDGTTVTLIGDSVIDETFTVTKNLTLDISDYSLTSELNSAFKVNSEVNFKITGEGTVNVAGMLVENTTSKLENLSISVEGRNTGIKINHTGVMNGTLFYMSSGEWDYTNLDVTLNVGNTSGFRVNYGCEVSIFMTGVEVSSFGHTNMNATVVYLSKNSYFELNYCSFDSHGGCVNFEAGAGLGSAEPFIVVNGSNLKSSRSTSANKLHEIGVFGSYTKFDGVIEVNDSYVEGSHRILLVNDNGTGKFIFNNSILYHNGVVAQAFGRSPNLEIREGSVLVSATYLTTLNSHDIGDDGNPSRIVLYPGARIDASVFASITALNLVKSESVTDADGNVIDVINHYELTNKAEAVIRFPVFDGEGNVVDYVKPSESDDYTFLHDASSNAEAPYVVVPITEDTESIYKLNSNGCFNGPIKADTLTEGFDNGLLYEAPDNTNHFTHYNNGSNNGGKATIGYLEGNHFWKFTSSGTVSSAAPCFMFGLAHGKGICETDYNVLVYEFDIATDALEFAEATLTVHARGDANGNSDFGGSSIRLTSDGTVKDASGNPIIQLSSGEWHHVTVVVDTTVEKGMAYYYVDGMFIQGNNAYKQNGAYLFGPRVNIDKDGITRGAGNTILMDNVTVRAFGSKDDLAEGESFETLTDKGLSYLVNGGKTINNYPVYSFVNIGGNKFTDIEDAILTGAEIGLAPTLNGDVLIPQTIRVNGLLYTGGYTIKLSDDSYLANVKNDRFGNSVSYEFAENLKNLTIDYKWFIGDISDPRDIEDEDKYIKVTYKVSDVPAIKESPEYKKYTNIGQNSISVYSHIGWSTNPYSDTAIPIVPITLSQAVNNAGKVVTLYPVFGYVDYKDYTYAVLDSEGNFDHAGKNAVLYGSQMRENMQLDYGETLVILSDVVRFAASFTTLKTNDCEKVYNIDLNGHRILVDPRDADGGYAKKIDGMFRPSEGETFNIYSSREGATVDMYGYKDIKVQINDTNKETTDDWSNDYNISCGALVVITKNNSTVNIGDCTVNGVTYKGSNLTVNTDNVVRVENQADDTSSVNIGGVNIVRKTNHYEAMFLAGRASSKINVKNSTIVLAAGGYLVGNLQEADAYLSKISFEGCTVITLENGADLISRNKNDNTIIFKNFVTNGTLNKAEGNAVAYAGTVAYKNELKTPLGYTVAKYNTPMESLGAYEGETVTFTYLVSNGERKGPIIEKPVVVSLFGSYTGEGTEISKSNCIVTKASQTVNVTFAGLGTNDAITETYAVGAEVLAPEIESYSYEYVTLVHNGKFDTELPDYIEDDMIFTPAYDVIANISGVKISMSLSENLGINVYIPAEYADMMIGATANGNEKEFVKVEKDGESYLVVTYFVEPQNATENVEFVIKVKEGELVGNATVCISIASYAEKILSGEYTEEDKTLVYATVNYANESANFVYGKHDAALSELIKNYAEYAGKKESNYEGAVAETGLSAAFIRATVRLGSAPAYVFTLKTGFIGTVTVTLGEKTFTYTVDEPKDRTIVVDGLTAYELAETLTVTVEGKVGDADVSVTEGKYNIATFANNYNAKVESIDPVIATPEEEAYLKAYSLSEALYSYVTLAKAYVTE